MRFKKLAFQKKRRKKWLPNIIKSSKKLNRPDYMLMGLILALTAFGLVMLSSASSVESFNKFGDTYYLFRHQILFGLLPGLVAFFFLSRINYQRFERYSLLFLAAALLILVMVFIPGIGATYGRARSWINIAGLSFQPTESVKLFSILFLAAWFTQRGKEMTQNFWNGLVPFAIILGLICLPIVLQPDIGTLVVIVMIALVMYFAAGARLKHLISLIIIGLGGFGILIAQAPYRAARLMTFLHPELDPQGVGYHINQAFLAIGSGGWLGLGLGQSRQKLQYLPEVIGDSIFAIIAEELGFIITALLIIVFLALLFRGLKLAQLTANEYGRYLVIGVITWFTLQAFLNMAAMVGLMPLTGIPLPFISYGGTALMSSLAAAGILVNISRQT